MEDDSDSVVYSLLETVADAERELERARAALHDAEVLFEGDGTDTGVLNRLYYASFHGAQAILYVRGENRLHTVTSASSSASTWSSMVTRRGRRGGFSERSTTTGRPQTTEVK